MEYLKTAQYVNTASETCTHLENRLYHNYKFLLVLRLLLNKNYFRNSLFFLEWSKYLDNPAIIPYDVIISGDLNFHLNNVSKFEACIYYMMLNSHGLIQQIIVALTKEATH